MRIRARSMTAAAMVALLGAAGCDSPEPAGGSMQGTDGGGASEVHTAEGTLNSIDRTAGTVNISHGPVESIGWPSMTMSFKLSDPAAAAALNPGQRVEFEFTADGGDATITEISASE